MQKKSTQSKNSGNVIRFVDKADEETGINLIDRTGDQDGAIRFIDKESPPPQPASLTSTGESSQSPQGAESSFPFLGIAGPPLPMAGPIPSTIELPKPVPTDQAIEAAKTLGHPYLIMGKGVLDAIPFSPTPLIFTGEDAQAQNVVERIMEKIGGLGGTIFGVVTVGNPITKMLFKKVGLEKGVTFLIDHFGERLGLAIANGLPLGVVSALQQDETFRNAVTDPTVQNIAKNVASRIEAFAFGEAAGTQYSLIGSTLKKWGHRAIANIIATNVTYQIHRVVNGEMPALPIEDVVYNSLMDIWFSKNPGHVTSDQHKQLMKFAQDIASMFSEPTIREIENSLKNNPDAIKQAASNAAKKFVAEKELEPFLRRAEKQRDKPVTFLSYDEIDALMQRAGVKDIKELKDFIHNDKAIVHESYYKLTKTIDALSSVKKNLTPRYKKYLSGAKKIKELIDYNAYKGDKNAPVLFDIYDGFTRVLKEDPTIALAETYVFDAMARELGMNTGDLVKSVSFTVKKADSPKTETEASVRVTSDGKVSIVAHNRSDMPLVGMHELFHVFTNLATDDRVISRLSNVDYDTKTLESFREELNGFFKKVYEKKYGDKWEEPLADEFVAYFATKSKDNPLFNGLAKTVVTTLERAYKRFDHVQYKETEPDMLLKMHSLFDRLLGTSRLRALNKDIKDWKVKTGQTKQVTDPAVYVNKVSGVTAGTKITNLLTDIKTRHDVIAGLSKRYVEKPTPTLQRRLNKLYKMQQRDIEALNSLSKYKYTYDPATGDIRPALELNQSGSARLARDMLVNNNSVITDPVSYSTMKFVSAIAGDNPQEALSVLRTYVEPLTKDMPDINPIALKLIQAMPEGDADVRLVKQLVERIAAKDKAGVDAILPIMEKSLVDKLREVQDKTDGEHWIDAYLDNMDKKYSKEITNVMERPTVDDINRFAEWVETPIFALRKFPEAQRQARLVINARLAHLYAVNNDVQFFYNVFRGIKRSEHPALRNAVTDAYKMSPDALNEKYGEKLGRAAVRLKDYFTGIKDQIKAYLKDVASRYVEPDVMEVFEKYQNETDKDKVYKAIRDAVKAGEITEYAGQKVRKLWNRYREIDSWGVWDYVTRIEQGTYKVIDKDGHVRAVRMSLEDAKDVAQQMKDRGEIEGGVEIIREFSKTDPMEHRGAVELKGDPNLLRSLKTYSYLVHKRLLIEPALFEAQKWMAQADEYVLPPNTKKLLDNLMEHVKGKYYFEDQVLDKILGDHKLPDMSASQVAGLIRKTMAAAKLGWRYGAVVVNVMSGLAHIQVGTDTRAFANAARLIGTAEGQKIIEQARPYIAETMIEGESGLFKGRARWFGPLGAFQLSEKGMREFAVLANYDYLKRQGMTHEKALEEAINATQVQLFLYDAAALPRSFRSPTMKLLTQFKAYLVQETEFVRSLPAKKLLKYLGMQIVIGGPQAIIHFVHSIPLMDKLGILDKLEDAIQGLKFPEGVPIIGGKSAGFGMMGLFNVDISMAAAAQFPERVEDWGGATVAAFISMWKMLKESMDIGVRDAFKIGKIHDVKSGLNVLLDDASQFAVVTKAWREGIDALFSEDENGVVWVRDTRGRKMYPILSQWDYLKLALGMKPTQRSIMQTKTRIYQKAIEKKILKRRALTDTFVKYYIDGATPPDWLYDELLRYGVSPQAIEQSLQNTELSPVERQMRVANYLDKMDAMDRVIDVQEILDAIKNGD